MNNAGIIRLSGKDAKKFVNELNNKDNESQRKLEEFINNNSNGVLNYSNECLFEIEEKL